MLDTSLTSCRGRRPVRPPYGAAPHGAPPAVLAAGGDGPALSPGLAQVLNAALIDPSFCAAFLASPASAARRAAHRPGQTFGTTLPDPAVRLAAPSVTEAELAVLGCLAPPTSLAAAARGLLALSRELEPAPSSVRDHRAAPAALSVEPSAHAPFTPPAAPAGYEGTLAGAA